MEPPREPHFIVLFERAAIISVLVIGFLLKINYLIVSFIFFSRFVPFSFILLVSGYL